MTRFERLRAERRRRRRIALETAWKVIHAELAGRGIEHRLFGSLARDDVRDHSDLDLMILGDLTVAQRAAVRRLAASAGDRISGLALLGVGAMMPVHPDLLAATKSNDPAAWDLIVSWGFGKPAHFGLNKAPGMWMQGGGRSLLARAPDDVLGIDMSACDVFKDALDAAAKVACPTLIIAGDRDMMAPPKVAAPLAEAIPDAMTIVLKNCGHIMMVERPDETLDALIDAL